MGPYLLNKSLLTFTASRRYTELISRGLFRRFPKFTPGKTSNYNQICTYRNFVLFIPSPCIHTSVQEPSTLSLKKKLTSVIWFFGNCSDTSVNSSWRSRGSYASAAISESTYISWTAHPTTKIVITILIKNWISYHFCIQLSSVQLIFFNLQRVKVLSMFFKKKYLVNVY